MSQTAGYTWTGRKTKTQIAKKLNITLVLVKFKITRVWIKHVNRMPGKGVVRPIKYTVEKAQYGMKATEESSGCGRQERVNKWPSSLIPTW